MTTTGSDAGRRSAGEAPVPARTRVAIVGGGTAGLLLALVLYRAGIESVVLERRTRQEVLSRVRPGVLEQGLADMLRSAGAGARMDRRGIVHDAILLAWRGRTLRIDLREPTGGRTVTVYGRTEVTHDLHDALDEAGVPVICEAAVVALHDLETRAPFLSYRRNGETRRLECDFVAGCDGSGGLCRQAIPPAVLRIFERAYPFNWVRVLSRTPPVRDAFVYARHERGFALCSPHDAQLSHCCIQCPAPGRVEDWPDERFFDELAARLPAEISADLAPSASIQRSILPLRSFIAEPMRHGRLFLAGDAAHLLPPTGAKGLNLAASDVAYLSRALIAHYQDKDDHLLDSYSRTALARVWRAERFAWWMTAILHRLDDDASGRRIGEAELDVLAGSQAARTALAENYVGLPY